MSEAQTLGQMLVALNTRVKNDFEARQNPEKEKNVADFSNVEVLNLGKEIILPVGMSKKEGIECLTRLMLADEEIVAVHELVDAHPYEGAYALMHVLAQVYGWSNPVPTTGFFGPKPPNFISYEIGFGKMAQVIWGRMEIPGIEGFLETAAYDKHGRVIFRLSGQVKKRYQQDIARIGDALRAYVKANSVYRHKAIRITTDDDGEIEWHNPPRFMDTSSTKTDNLIFSDETMRHIRTHIFAPIEKTEACRAAGIPMKRTVLLEGPFGTGKTLTATVTAKKVEDGKKWTFIYLDKVEGLKDCLLFAKQYQPCVIFAEDCDRAISGERDTNVDDILNTIDGIDTKSDEIFTILTSNDVDSIEKAMIRPGRFDAIIHVGPPDQKAAEKLMRYYAGSYLPATADVTDAALELAGQIPATIAEVVKRAKIYMVDTTPEGEPLFLTGADLLDAAKGMKAHLDILHGEVEEETVEERVGSAFAQLIKEQSINGLAKKVDEIHGKFFN